MKIDKQRELALKILSTKSVQINVYDYDEYVINADDITDIASFLEQYTSKYENTVFDVDPSGIITIKLQYISDIINSINELTPHDFEKLSSIICKGFGYNNYLATSTPDDQGIDFIAFKSFPGINIDYKYHIIGQSKHFKNNLVGTQHIRELAGSILLFSRREFTNDKKYERFKLGAFAPINVFFITNYFFSDDAIDLCKKSNIIPLDAIDISCLIANEMHKGTLNWMDTSANFVKTNFLEDLNRVEIVK